MNYGTFFRHYYMIQYLIFQILYIDCYTIKELKPALVLRIIHFISAIKSKVLVAAYFDDIFFGIRDKIYRIDLIKR